MVTAGGSGLWTRQNLPSATTSFPWLNYKFVAELSSIATKLRSGRAERFSNDEDGDDIDNDAEDGDDDFG